MIVLMASGTGTNFKAIIEDGIKIDLVITNKENAGIINLARKLGVQCIVSTANYESQVPKNTKLVILAGFMRLLSKEFVSKFKVINIHPSLLPSFPGDNAIGQALDAGVKVTGCTVHWVDEGMDTGRIIAQLSCKVFNGDDYTSLSTRIQRLEHQLYSTVIKLVVQKMQR